MTLKSEVNAATLAMSFLTVLPVPNTATLAPGALGRATAYFPVAGYLIGGFVGLTLLLPIDVGVAAALALGLWWALTGWLHFDGLVDSADALLAPVSAQDRAAIFKDVHVGAFGLGTAVITALIMWSALASELTPWAPLVAAVIARTVVLWPMWAFPTLEQDSLGGQASNFRPSRALIAIAIAAPTLLVPGAWLAWLVAVPMTALVAWWAARRLQGRLSGDVYGLLITMAEGIVVVTFTFI